MAVALADRRPAPLGPAHGPNDHSRLVPSGRRDARSVCGHRMHSLRGGAADGGPLVYGRRQGLQVEHRRRGAEAPSKVREVGHHRASGAAETV
jgi:hypothetical protein